MTAVRHGGAAAEADSLPTKGVPKAGTPAAAQGVGQIVHPLDSINARLVAIERALGLPTVGRLVPAWVEPGRVYRVAEIARNLDCSRTAVYKAIRTGRLAQLPGPDWNTRILGSAVAAWLSTKRASPKRTRAAVPALTLAPEREARVRELEVRS